MELKLGSSILLVLHTCCFSRCFEATTGATILSVLLEHQAAALLQDVRRWPIFASEHVPNFVPRSHPKIWKKIHYTLSYIQMMC
jgi:hypothetical protein